MRFKDIIIWLLVFIVGSLIVSFLIYPQSFQSFKNNFKDIFPEKEEVRVFQSDEINLDITSNAPQNNIQTKSPEFEIIETDTGYWGKCSLVKLSAQDRGMSEKEMKKTLCELHCGELGLDYYSYRCDKDIFYCSCKR